MLKQFAILTLIIALLGCQTRSGSQVEVSVPAFVLLPHHLLVEDKIREVYQIVAASREEADYELRRVFILSPDHFGYGASKVQIVPELGIFPIDQSMVSKLANFELARDANKSTLEPGLTVHSAIAWEYLPNVEFVPIRLKNGATTQELDRLLLALSENFNPKTDLLVASIDFAHYVSDEHAVANDQKIMTLLSSEVDDLADFLARSKKLAASPNPAEPLGVGIDSPESLAILLALRPQLGNDYEIKTLERTSTKTVTGIDVSKDNTSHLYAIWYGRLALKSR